MGVNVDTVYQRVLSILNKEQRGFLTPQKFNLYANQVQLSILEAYFYDLDYYLTQAVGNNTHHADMVSILETKIAKFLTEGDVTYSNPHFILPSDCYRLSSMLFNDVEVEQVTKKKYREISKSPIAQPTNACPVYTESTEGIRIYGDTPIGVGDLANVSAEYIKIPVKTVWGYTTVFGAAQYDASTSVNFELDPSEETDLVIKILALAGLEVKDLSIYEVATGADNMEMQQEKS